MKGLFKKLVVTVVVAIGVLTPVTSVLMAEPAMAACPNGYVETNIFGDANGCVKIDDQGSGIKQLLGLVLQILLYGIGVVAVIGVVVAGVMYLTARDSEVQVAKAKMRLVEVVIGLIAWAMLFALLQWLIPGFRASDLDQYTSRTDNTQISEVC